MPHIRDTILKPLKSLYSALVLRHCRKEANYASSFNERPVEYAFVFRQIARRYPKRVLDVGTGLSSLPHLVKVCGCQVDAVDNVRDYWRNGLLNRHYEVKDVDIRRPPEGLGTYDLITCISVLEHIEEHERAFAGMVGLLKPGGRLVLSFPYNEKRYAKNLYDIPGSNAFGKGIGFSTQAFSRAELDKWLAANPSMEIEEQEYWRFHTGEYWTVGEMVLPPTKTDIDALHDISCVALVKKQCAAQRQGGSCER